MANPFDQFDETESNPFDQFDVKPTAETESKAGPVSQDDPYFLPIEEGQTQPVPPAPGVKGVGDFSAGENALGAVETGLAALTGGSTGMVSGALGGAAGAIGDLLGYLTPEEAQELQRRATAAGTYEPKTEAGQAQTKAIGELTESLPPVTGAATPRVRIGKESISPRLPEGVERAVRFADENKLPLMQSDVKEPGTFAGKAIRGLAEKVPITGTGAAREKQQAARQDVISDFLGRYDTVTDQDLYNSLINSQNKKKQALGKQYKDVETAMGDAKVLPTKTLKAIDYEIEQLNRPGVIKDDAVISNLERVRDQLASGEVDFKTMRKNRTFVRESLKSEKAQTMSDRVIDEVYNAMTDDIQDAVRSVAGEDFANKLKAADRALYGQKNEAKKTKLKNVLAKGDVKPEEVTKMLLSNDKSENLQLYKELGKNGRKNARAVLVGELGKIYDSNDSPEKFLDKAKKLENQFNVFFRGEEGEAFKDMISYLNQTRQASKAGVFNQNGQQLMTLFSAAPAVDIVSTGGALSGVAGGVGLLGRALESRKIRNGLRRIKNTRPYTPEYNQALIALDNAVNELNDEADSK